MGQVVIVDENDSAIGLKERDQLTLDDIGRKSVLWITNSSGQILLTQRSTKKTTAAGKWSAAVAGTVDEGESYESNIIKEAFEEIGLSLNPSDLMLGDKVRVKTQQSNHFAQWYSYVTDKTLKDFSIQHDEVSAIKWMDPVEVGALLDQYPEQLVPTAPLWRKMGLIP